MREVLPHTVKVLKSWVKQNRIGTLEIKKRGTDVTPEQLRRGQILWATLDAPWLDKVDRSKFGRELQAVRSMAPERIMSTHLPPAVMSEAMLEAMAAATEAPPFPWPDQAALDQMLAQMTQGRPAAE